MTFQDYLDSHNMHRTEGEGGLKNLERLFSDLGYQASGFRFGTLIETFLADNPGAVEGLFNWVEEQIDRTPEWKESLGLDDEDNEDEGDEDEE